MADLQAIPWSLPKKLPQTTADIMVFAGVHFMAETAKTLNPSKKVLLPDLKAGCSLAESCPPEVRGTTYEVRNTTLEVQMILRHEFAPTLFFTLPP